MKTYEELISLLKNASHAYYNTSKPIMSDREYDSIRDYLETSFPDYKNVIGADIIKKKVRLPYFMPSLNKIKDNISSWGYSGDVLLTDKLDGNSAMFIGSSMKLYSRGNGKEGQDISYLIPYLKNNLIKNDYVIRGELISKDYNRNIVAGVMNSKNIDKNILKTISFVGYQIISPIMTPYEQFEVMKSLVPVVFNKPAKTRELTKEMLTLYYLERKNKTKYDIDGIVVTHNAEYPIPDVLKNPKYTFAFKTSDGGEMITTKVKEVEWNISKDGILVPVVCFDEVIINNVVITRSTGYNAKYIVDNGIGKGSVIIVERSGSVIPKIIKVITSVYPDMPSTEYIWDKTKTNILINDIDSDDFRLANLIYFFDKMDVTYVSKGILKRIYNSGYITIYDILNISIDNLLEIDGFKEKMAYKVYNALKNIDMNPYKIMDASNIMGRGIGYEKIKSICDQYPDIILKNYIPTITELLMIEGIGNKTAELFIKNLPKFYNFIETNKLKLNNVVKNKVTQIIVFSQVRDKELENKIINNGDIVKNTITKQTTMLVVKSPSDVNTKIKAAKEMNIPIITIEQFKNEYK